MEKFKQINQIKTIPSADMSEQENTHKTGHILIVLDAFVGLQKIDNWAQSLKQAGFTLVITPCIPEAVAETLIDAGVSAIEIPEIPECIQNKDIVQCIVTCKEITITNTRTGTAITVSGSAKPNPST